MVEKVKLDERGRITLPKQIREKHNFSTGEEFEIIDENDKIILKLVIPEQKRVKSNLKWSKNAFSKAGEATFGD